MPSNQIPEDVREQIAGMIALVTIVPASYARTDAQAESVRSDLIDAIAPLIIEWARKDQAEKDHQIAWDIAQVQYNKGRTDVSFGANQVCEALTYSPTPAKIRQEPPMTSSDPTPDESTGETQ